MAFYEIGVRFVGPEPDDPLILRCIKAIQASNRNPSPPRGWGLLAGVLLELSNREFAKQEGIDPDGPIVKRIEAHIAITDRYNEKSRRRRKKDGSPRDPEQPAAY